ncbi:MAG: hypothetical protein KDA60_11010 [Planctomycetales bacterium]|nr:hypothetical protein [Planctomycetales bacterium]
MSLTIQDFWNLLQSSGLASESRCSRLQARFNQVQGAVAQANPHALAEWLIAERAISRYQAKLLLAGRPGPFLYRDYLIYSREEADVFRGIHVPSRHPVVLEFVTPAVVGGTLEWPTVADLLARHCQASSPAIGDCYELVDLGLQKFIAVEDITGPTITRYLEKSGPVPLTLAARWIHDLAAALGTLHDKGLSYGCLTSSRVRLVGGKLPCLERRPLRALQMRDGLSVMIQEFDEVQYAAPELAVAGTFPDPLTDIYALGVLFFQCVTGKTPFSGSEREQVLERHAREPIATIRGPASKPLNQLISFMMAKRRDVRTASAREVARQLATWVENPMVSATRKPAPTLEAYRRVIDNRRPSPAEPAVRPTRVTILPVTTGPPSFAPPPTGTQVDALTTIESPIGEPTPVQIVSGDGPPVTSRRTQRRPTSRVKTWAAAATCCLSLILALVWVTHNVLEERDTPSNRTHSGEPVAQSPTVPPNSPAFIVRPRLTSIGRYDIVPDDGDLPWAPPTAGAPPELRYVPNGPQCLIFLNPADLLATDEGPRVLASLGPAFVDRREAWESALGLDLEEIERLIVAYFPGSMSQPIVTTTVLLPEGQDIRQRWSTQAAEDFPDGKLFSLAGRSAYVPDAQSGRLLVDGPEAAVRSVAEIGEAAPVLRSDLEKLWQATDGQRHFNLLCVPNFLFRDGRGMFRPEYASLLAPLDELFRDDVRAVLVSAHLVDETQLYVESRLRSRVDTPTSELNSRVSSKLQQFVSRTKRHVANMRALDPYWRQLAFRVDAMLDFLADNTRIGAESDEVLVNAYLPAQAAHNLLLTAELSLALSQPQSATIASQPQTAITTMEDLLQQRLSFSIPQQSLEFALRDLANEINEGIPGLEFRFGIKIMGTDLEKDGITRNQSIRDFRQENTTVDELLTALVMRANPVTTVKSPAELDQKLVWVVDPGSVQGDEKLVLITTRTGAANQEYDLPAVFVPRP